MRKTCVRWTKSVRATLIVAIAIVSALAVNTGAQSSDPSTLPLLTAANVQYLGGFRLPRESSNGDSFASGGGKTLAFSPVTNTLFVSSRGNRVAEVTIPRPVISSDVNAMPFASYLQPFVDPTEGTLAQVGSGVSITGLMVYGDRLYGTANVYYDATNAQRVSHFSRSLQLNQPSFSGWSQVWDTGKAGFVSGFLSPVPVEWRSRLGGPAATGQCCIPIVSRTSWGPAAFAFDPARVGQGPVPASPMVYYTGNNPSLGGWSGSNPVYGATTMIGGMALIGGTRTALFVGRNGLGSYCYGNGSSVESQHLSASPDGSHYCYDPTASDKGTHAYPYRFQIWAYDLNDMAAVRAGTKQPWDVLPYGVWPFDFPTFEKQVRIGGVTYDAERQLLYVAQLLADKDGYQSRPIIHVFQLDLPPAPVPVSRVTVSANRTAPQLTNTPITFAATTADGVPPFQYKWAVSKDGNTWQHAAWSETNTFTWAPAVAETNYHVGVWARSAWNQDDAGEASAAIPFAIAAPPPPPPPAPAPAPAPPASKVTAVAVSGGPSSTVITGTATNWTAAVTGGASPVQYKWLVNNGYAWIVYKDWSADHTFTYVPGIAGTNRISVLARSAGNTKDVAEASVNSSSFAVAGPTMVTPLPPPQISNKVLAVFVAPNVSAPQPVGSTVTWTATAVGGIAPALYKYLIHDGTNWVAQGGWTTSTTFAWKPATPGGKYRLSVWAKSPANTADAPEASTVFEYFIIGLQP